MTTVIYKALRVQAIDNYRLTPHTGKWVNEWSGLADYGPCLCNTLICSECGNPFDPFV